MYVVPSQLTAEQSAQEAANGQNGDVHLLAVQKELAAHSAIVMFPEGVGIIADVTGSGISMR